MAKKKTNKTENKGGWIKYLWMVFALGVSSIVLLFVLIANGVIGYLPEIEELQNPKNKFASEVYTADGEIIGRYYYGKDNRVAVSYDQISPNVINALISTEDVRFYEHSGIDFRALFRSIIKRGV